jgi:prepilin-type N-terminal cleavage/methylation domain-containing protein
MMKSHSKRNTAGFTLIELMIATGITLTLLYAAVSIFRDASQSNNFVTQASDMSENFRAGLNMIQLDLQQVGTGSVSRLRCHAARPHVSIGPD